MTDYNDNAPNGLDVSDESAMLKEKGVKLDSAPERGQVRRRTRYFTQTTTCNYTQYNAYYALYPSRKWPINQLIIPRLIQQRLISTNKVPMLCWMNQLQSKRQQRESKQQAKWYVVHCLTQTCSYGATLLCSH